MINLEYLLLVHRFSDKGDKPEAARSFRAGIEHHIGLRYFPILLEIVDQMI